MKNYTLYLDGSDLKHTTHRLGIGGVLVDSDTDQKIHEFSQEVSRAEIEINYGDREVSNPTAELYSVLIGLREIRDIVKPGDRVIIKNDYLGPSKWMTGAWKITKPYIQGIHDDILSEIKTNFLGVKIAWGWVKGHQSLRASEPDPRWNNYVDKLAKGL